MKIPGFQRNYVWDIKRASKLIESLLLGLPVPQVFLYEEGPNRFLVIDGQQRLMSIYFFMAQRFPRPERRVDLRDVFDQHGKVPESVLQDDKYFSNFRLSLPAHPDRPNKFKGLNYATLGDYRTPFDLRPIRNIIVKQNRPEGDDSSIYEIFNRLNTGGVNLRSQEIRTSLYHSDFYEMLHRINNCPLWRRITQTKTPDLHRKDVEILLRGFALLIDGEKYSPSMVRFLNKFSKMARGYTTEFILYLQQLFEGFLAATQDLPVNAFINRRNNRFNIALFEATFVAACTKPLEAAAAVVPPILESALRELEKDDGFVKAATEGTTQKPKVDIRLARARAILCRM